MAKWCQSTSLDCPSRDQPPLGRKVSRARIIVDNQQLQDQSTVKSLSLLPSLPLPPPLSLSPVLISLIISRRSSLRLDAQSLAKFTPRRLSMAVASELPHYELITETVADNFAIKVSARAVLLTLLHFPRVLHFLFV